MCRTLQELRTPSMFAYESTSSQLLRQEDHKFRAPKAGGWGRVLVSIGQVFEFGRWLFILPFLYFQRAPMPWPVLLTQEEGGMLIIIET